MDYYVLLEKLRVRSTTLSEITKKCLGVPVYKRIPAAHPLLILRRAGGCRYIRNPRPRVPVYKKSPATGGGTKKINGDG